VQRTDDGDAYVYRILLNCFRDGRRRRWWTNAHRVPDRSEDDRTELVDLADAVHRALTDLAATRARPTPTRGW
jgi:hypothetical protein